MSADETKGKETFRGGSVTVYVWCDSGTGLLDVNDNSIVGTTLRRHNLPGKKIIYLCICIISKGKNLYFMLNYDKSFSLAGVLIPVSKMLWRVKCV